MAAMTHYNQHTFTNEQVLERLPHEPTQEEIKAMCAEIRKTWSEQTRRSRRVINNAPVTAVEIEQRWAQTELHSILDRPQNSWG